MTHYFTYILYGFAGLITLIILLLTIFLILKSYNAKTSPARARAGRAMTEEIKKLTAQIQNNPITQTQKDDFLELSDGLNGLTYFGFSIKFFRDFTLKQSVSLQKKPVFQSVIHLYDAIQEFTDAINAVPIAPETPPPVQTRYASDAPEARSALKISAPITQRPKAYKNNPSELDRQISTFLDDFVKKTITRPRVVTLRGIVLTYENAYNSVQVAIENIRTPENIDQKIKEILTNYPGADLKQIEKDLGIKITNFQRKDDDGFPQYDLPVNKP